jgi:hypothetical protein
MQEKKPRAVNAFIVCLIPLLLATAAQNREQAFTITGTVKRTGGAAIRGATVWLSHRGEFATTDANGAFTLAGEANKAQMLPNNNTVFGRPRMSGSMLYFGVEPASAEAAAEVYDVAGKQIRTVFNQRLTRGEYRVPIDAAFLPAGLYCVKLRVGGMSSFFKMPIFSRRIPRNSGLAPFRDPSAVAEYLAKPLAGADTLWAGCADCIAQGKEIAAYSGAYSFVLATAAYAPPKYIINSAANFKYSLYQLPSASIFNTKEMNGLSWMEIGGNRYVVISNYVFLGDSIRYMVDISDSSLWSHYYNTWPPMSHDTTLLGDTMQCFTDPSSFSGPLFWDEMYALAAHDSLYSFLRQATFNGSAVTVSEKYYGRSLSPVWKFSNDIGQIFAAGASYGYRLTNVNGSAVDTNSLRYLRFNPAFGLGKDTGYAFVNMKLFYKPIIFNPDTLGYSISLLSQPQGMTVRHDTIVWLPAVKDTGNRDLKVRLADSQGKSDTLAMRVSVLRPSVEWLYFKSDSSISRIDMGYPDSLQAPRAFVFGEYDSIYYPAAGFGVEQYAFSPFRNITLDSALEKFWEDRISILKNAGGTERKALFRSDTISVRSVTVDAVTSATVMPPQHWVTTAVVARSIGLISYKSDEVFLNTSHSYTLLRKYKGQPFDTTEVLYLP